MKDAATTVEKLTILQVIVPVCRSAEMFYRRSRSELTNIKSEYDNLLRRLKIKQLIKESE